MVLLSYVKQCKKCDFYLGRERDFIMFLVMGKRNGPLQKKEKKNPHPSICALGCTTMN
jgi:hypothetical protein